MDEHMPKFLQVWLSVLQLLQQLVLLLLRN